MHKKTFSINGATITVRTQDGSAYIDKMSAEVALGLYRTHETDGDGHTKGERVLPRRVSMQRTQFATVWAQSEVEGDLGFEWPEAAFDEDEMIAACEAWLKLPGTAVGEWINAIYTVNVSPNDPDLKPPEQVDPKD